MKKPSSRAFRPGLAALESRRLMAGPGDLGFIGPVAPPPPDNQLEVFLRVTPPANGVGARAHFEVDGSDFDDQVEVLGYQAGWNGSVTLRLEQYSGGVRYSSRTAQFRVGDAWLEGQFSSNRALIVHGKGGQDVITNRTAANMTAHGGPGIDHLLGGLGFDYLNGNEGADYLNDSAGVGTMDGGPGDDNMFASRDGALMFGGPDNDSMYGSGAQESLYGGDGNDLIVGDWTGTQSGSGDLLYGGEGDDTIQGSGGDDRVYGSGGNDHLDAGIGIDTIWGGNGNDLMYGGAGNDRLYGEWGKDELHGGLNDDYLDAGYFTDNSSFTEGESLFGDHGGDTFVRHISVFWGVYTDDGDVFRDYNSSSGDRVEKTYHW